MFFNDKTTSRSAIAEAAYPFIRRDLDRLKKNLLLIGSKVEDAINKSILALTTRRKELAEAIIEGDEEIDDREVALEEDCLKILALHQPVAIDLRRVTTVLKINAELERIADLAVNIAERTQGLCEHPEFPIPEI